MLPGWRKLREKIHDALAGETDARAFAGGFAVGVFFSFTPLVSLHTVLALMVAFIFRLSKISAAAGVWVNNPYTMPFVFYGSFRLGEWLLGKKAPLACERFTLDAILKTAKPCIAPLMLGTTIVGLAAAVIAYFIVHGIAVRVKSARHASGKDQEGSGKGGSS